MATTQTEQAEQAVIGALLRDNRTLYRIGHLEPHDFADGVHREFFAAIRDMVLGGQRADLITLADQFAGDSDLAYLGEIVHNTPSTAGAEGWAGIVRETSVRRQATEILTAAVERIGTDAEVVDDTIGRLTALQTHRQADQSAADVGALVDEWTAACQARRETGGTLGVSTTLPTLDGYLDGFQPGKVYVLGARPGGYKSAFALQVALAGAKAGRPTGLISLEMSATDLGVRARSGVGLDSSWPFRVDDRSSRLPEIRARVAEWRQRHKVELVVLDYLQLVHSSARSRFEELADVSRTCKRMAMDFDLAILALSQVNRTLEKESRMPVMSDLRESGNLEQDADVVMFLHSEANKNGPGADGDEHSLLLAKNRSGAARVRPIALSMDAARCYITEKWA